MMFVADRMLGRLAKWLRILGFDTIYLREADQARLKQLAAEGRLILTRDSRLRGEGIVQLTANDTWGQLEEVCTKLKLSPQAEPFSRCSVCNEPLVDISRSEVEGRVPEHVLATHEEFSSCPRCHRIYWPGTHVERMAKRLAALRGTGTR